MWDAQRSFPAGIVAATDPLTWSTDEFWSVYNPGLGLHTSFGWIGCGAFFRGASRRATRR